SNSSATPPTASHSPPKLEAVHPLGKAPVLEITPTPTPSDDDPSPAPIRLAESGYITQYLVEHFGDRKPGLAPPRWRPGREGKVGGETEAYARFWYLLHYVEESFFPVLVQFILINVLKLSNVPFPIPPPYLPRRLQNLFPRHFSQYAKVPRHARETFSRKTAPGVSADSKGFLCGPELTAADILISFALITADAEECMGYDGMKAKVMLHLESNLRFEISSSIPSKNDHHSSEGNLFKGILQLIAPVAQTPRQIVAKLAPAIFQPAKREDKLLDRPFQFSKNPLIWPHSWTGFLDAEKRSLRCQAPGGLEPFVRAVGAIDADAQRIAMAGLTGRKSGYPLCCSPPPPENAIHFDSQISLPDDMSLAGWNGKVTNDTKKKLRVCRK
ncbi:glutathione S-transferase domain-containing protein, partial [Colletotrichum salicis]